MSILFKAAELVMIRYCLIVMLKTIRQAVLTNIIMSKEVFIDIQTHERLLRHLCLTKKNHFS